MFTNYYEILSNENKENSKKINYLCNTLSRVTLVIS